MKSGCPPYFKFLWPLKRLSYVHRIWIELVFHNLFSSFSGNTFLFEMCFRGSFTTRQSHCRIKKLFVDLQTSSDCDLSNSSAFWNLHTLSSIQKVGGSSWNCRLQDDLCSLHLNFLSDAKHYFHMKMMVGNFFIRRDVTRVVKTEFGLENFHQTFAKHSISPFSSLDSSNFNQFTFFSWQKNH